MGWDIPETLNYTPHVHVVPVVEYLEKGLHTFLSLGPEARGPWGGDFPGGGTRTEVKQAATSETKPKTLRVFRLIIRIRLRRRDWRQPFLLA